ncbi:hypothetical protein [Hyphomicrobium sp.]|uniref:hypothetical protein n=1 Tax=Hyphomicrobium sp. TaxID=82 RepID=UPI0025C313A1|nr:hypothetical protein [Hyphomicrobium sp.]MCC7250670.1 hypothetical protein [Hyphomicrobium sp.]
MLELVVSVCLLEDHSRCKEVSLTYMGESTTPMMCMMMSPAEIAKWNESNPKWFAKKWSCRPAGRFAKI